MRVLFVDSRDSFTFNLVQAFAELGGTVDVVTDPAAAARAVDGGADGYDLICIGPGPRGPADLTQLVELAGDVYGRVPLLGICLGLQAIAVARGGTVGRARSPLHGVVTPVTHEGHALLRGLPNPLRVMRYHSLVARQLPRDLAVVAHDDEGQVMAVADDAARVWAVQFHPESIGTEGGLGVLANALGLAAGKPDAFAARVRYRPGSIPEPGGWPWPS